MFKLIRSLFSGVLYFQIWENRIKVVNIKNNKVYDVEPLIAIDITNPKHHLILCIGKESAKFVESETIKIINPFSINCNFENSFDMAGKLLKFATISVHDSEISVPAPKIIIHFMSDCKYQSSELKKLTKYTGAVDMINYHGEELSASTINFKDLKSKLK